jgi:outer membrane beta-barrel protein
VELRERRFELGAGVSTTLGQDFYHAVLVGGKASFHLTDWLAIGGSAAFNITPKFQTSFHDRLEILPERRGTDRTPTLEEAKQGMNRIGQAFAAQAELVPFTGKFSLFGKIFANYDFYAFGGPGFINFASEYETCSAAGPSCPVTGIKVGGNFGVGMHAFINDFLAINIELRDILLRNNPAGRDETGDGVADDSDLSWDSNYFFGVNLSLFLPSTAAISD